MNDLQQLTLPAGVLEDFTSFCQQVESALGEQLISFVAFGNVARGDSIDPKLPMLHVMIVLKEIRLEDLDEMAKPVRKSRENCGLTVMLLTEDELLSSADVFPVKFLEMKRHHVLLAGRDLLSDLDIPKEHLRLRCEQQLKNLSLKLRTFYLFGSAQPKEMRKILEQTGSAFVDTLRGYLCLKHEDAPLHEIQVAEKAAQEMGWEADTLKAILALKDSSTRINPADLQSLYGRFLKSAAIAADVLDSHKIDD